MFTDGRGVSWTVLSVDYSTSKVSPSLPNLLVQHSYKGGEARVRKAQLKPWVCGPYELIRHAEGHRAATSDTDRRMALIGYDNAVEV